MIAIDVIRQDCTLALRQRGELLTLLLFFVVVVTLIPFAQNPDPALLQKIMPGMMWIAALLANLLGLHRIFHDSYTDGTLEQLMLSTESLALNCLSKMFAHWLLTGFLLTLIAIPLGAMYNLNAATQRVLFITLLMGTPCLSLLGGFASALTLGLRNSNTLIALLIFPLMIPTLIFGTNACVALSAGDSTYPYFAILASISLASLALCPIATASALRISLE